MSDVQPDSIDDQEKKMVPTKGQDGSPFESAAVKQADREAVSVELKSIPPLSETELAPMAITMEDFLEAIKRVQPSAKREGFATVPNVSWEDIGALVKVCIAMHSTLRKHLS